jgi:hypothetical protein
MNPSSSHSISSLPRLDIHRGQDALGETWRSEMRASSSCNHSKSQLHKACIECPRAWIGSRMLNLDIAPMTRTGREPTAWEALAVTLRSRDPLHLNLSGRGQRPSSTSSPSVYTPKTFPRRLRTPSPLFLSRWSLWVLRPMDRCVGHTVVALNAPHSENAIARSRIADPVRRSTRRTRICHRERARREKDPVSFSCD